MTRYLKNKLSQCPMNVMLKYLIVVLCWFHISNNGVKSESPLGDPGSSIQHRDFAFPDEIQVNTGPKPYFHNHHSHPPYHHSHHFHDHSENPQPRRYPDLERPSNIEPNTSAQIPLEVIYNINELDVDDILTNYVEGVDKFNEPTLINERFGGIEGKERKAASVPSKAGCIPELRTVKVAENTDPTILYIPQCTRVERCGGCCSHALLSCQPTETEFVNYEIFKTQFVGGKKLKALGKEIVSIEKHLKCKCDCRVKPQDCGKFQEYRKSECRCACTNFDEEQKCNKNSVRKLWNPDLCVCQCRETIQCSTGSYFDQNECKCKMTPFNRRFVNNDQMASVIPLNEDT